MKSSDAAASSPFEGMGDITRAELFAKHGIAPSDSATSTEVVSFEGVGRGPRAMVINGRLRPAYEWCEMFGHVLVGGMCKTCGGLTDVQA